MFYIFGKTKQGDVSYVAIKVQDLYELLPTFTDTTYLYDYEFGDWVIVDYETHFTLSVIEEEKVPFEFRALLLILNP